MVDVLENDWTSSYTQEVLSRKETLDFSWKKISMKMKKKVFKGINKLFAFEYIVSYAKPMHYKLFVIKTCIETLQISSMM